MNEVSGPRESMEFDVVIVGARPAGLAPAIRLKQINLDISIVVVEKSAEVGAHILAEAVVDPIGFDTLLSDWREDNEQPFKVPVTEVHFYEFKEKKAKKLPNFIMPKILSNHGNYIVSLGNVCAWLAGKAESLGVEIYPGFAAPDVLYNVEGAVIGIATGYMGIEKDESHGPNYMRGMALFGKYW